MTNKFSKSSFFEMIEYFKILTIICQDILYFAKLFRNIVKLNIIKDIVKFRIYYFFLHYIFSFSKRNYESLNDIHILLLALYHMSKKKESNEKNVTKKSIP